MLVKFSGGFVAGRNYSGDAPCAQLVEWIIKDDRQKPAIQAAPLDGDVGEDIRPVVVLVQHTRHQLTALHATNGGGAAGRVLKARFAGHPWPDQVGVEYDQS